ncbi:hypothetical protein KKC17_04485 [Patescibacteria group bacterium]|nr:hypothetical protein [Patescibacteria group bacterium]
MKILKNNQPAGMVLLLSLLVLAGVLVTSLTVGSLVLRQLRVSVVSDQSQAAYYAAESGLEQGLYLWRLEQKKGADLVVSQSSSVVLAGNQATWWRSSVLSESSEIITLKKNDSRQIDLFNPEDSLDSAVKAQSIKLSWDNNVNSCPGAGSEWLEVGWSAWLGAATLDYDVERRYFSSSQASGVVINLDPSFVNYRLRLRALYSDVCDLTVQAFRQPNGVGEIYELPGRVIVTSVGRLANTQQSLSVTLPALPPQAAVFDYAIFSQCSIFKGTGFTSDCY